MMKRFKVGDRVSWNSEAGRVSRRIVKVHIKDVDYVKPARCHRRIVSRVIQASSARSLSRSRRRVGARLKAMLS
jgi:hypothetical protein